MIFGAKSDPNLCLCPFFFLIPAAEHPDIEAEAEIAQISSYISVILQSKIDKTNPFKVGGGADCSEFAPPPRCLRRWPPL